MSELSFANQAPDQVSFLSEVLEGLNAPEKTLPCKYFYDKAGSRLFDRICDLPEYYLTRTELQIMESHAAEMAEQIGPGVMLVEYGSGSSVKTRILLDHLEDASAYVPVDISEKHLYETALQLSERYLSLDVLPVCADFTEEFELPTPIQAHTHTAVYFPGSTIGNFEPDEAERLLAHIAPLCGVGGGLLIGVDLKKDRDSLEAAYNDKSGVTAQFNLNLLHRINRELDADFDLDQFQHVAAYNEELGRIEMFLQSTQNQVVNVSGSTVSFADGELICTEHSHKYTIDEFSQMAASVGLTLRRSWTDDRKRFAVLHFAIVG